MPLYMVHSPVLVYTYTLVSFPSLSDFLMLPGFIDFTADQVVSCQCTVYTCLHVDCGQPLCNTMI